MKYANAFKRFGSRYGLRIKKKLAKIESNKKGRHKCPYCNYNTAKWSSVGIWHCTKCGATFSDKAYSLSMKKNASVKEGKNGSS